MTRSHLRIACCLAALIAAGSSTADAGVFDVKGSDITKGEKEIGVNSSFFSGYPVNAERLQSTIEVGAGYGLTDWFKAGAKITFDKASDEDLRASTAGIEGQFVLRKFDKGIGVGWFTGADFALQRDETNTITFGPIFQFGTDKTQLLVNPFFSRTFGDNRTTGTDFSYAWAIKQEIRENLSIGIEGHGSIANIADSQGIDFQEHRIGPVIYYTRDLVSKNGNGNGRGLSIKDMKMSPDAGNGADGPKFNLEAGVLFGLTDGTQDVTFKLKGGITF